MPTLQSDIRKLLWSGVESGVSAGQIVWLVSSRVCKIFLHSAALTQNIRRKNSATEYSHSNFCKEHPKEN